MESIEKRTIAVINGSMDLLEIVSEILASEGYSPIVASVQDFRTGKKDFKTFINQYRPAVLIYDIAPPYELNVNFFSLLVKNSSLRNRCILLVAADTKALEHMEPLRNSEIEILTKPFDVQKLIHLVSIKANRCKLLRLVK